MANETQEKILNTVIVLRNDGSANWASSTVVLRKGEIGVCYLDNGNVVVKAGDDVHTWSQLRQIEGVFEQPVTLTQNFGYFTGVPSGGKLTFDGTNDTIDTTGMTTSEFLMAALKKTIEPEVSLYPSASLSVNKHTTDTGTNEIGSKIKSLEYSGSFTDGQYKTADKTTNTGLKAIWSVTCTGADETTAKTSNTGTFNFSGNNRIQIISTSAADYGDIDATVTLNMSSVVTPENNLGESRSDKVIAGFDANGTQSTSLLNKARSITGFRNIFRGCITEDSTALVKPEALNGQNITNAVWTTVKDTFTSTWVRTNLSPTNSATKPTSLTIKDKTKQIFICLPHVDGRTLTVKDSAGFGVAFTKIENGVKVEGANNYTAIDYDVWTYCPASTLGSNTYTLTWNK